MRPLNILVIDDNPGDLRLFQEAIKESGIPCELTTALGAAEGLKIVMEKNLDLIVLDVMMPGMSGYAACNALKNHSPYKDIPILLLTSREQEIDSLNWKKMGIHYLQKPPKPKELLAKIEEIIK